MLAREERNILGGPIYRSMHHSPGSGDVAKSVSFF